MSRLHEIKSRIAGVGSTRQITRAMYLISASKSQKAKQQLEVARPYFHSVSETLSEILAVSGMLDTYYLDDRMGRNSQSGIVLVMGADKGMAGGYNQNIVKLLRECADKEHDEILVAGILGRATIAREGFRVDPDFRHPVMNPSVYRAMEIADLLVNRYIAGGVRDIRVIYTNMISPIKQEPVCQKILPLEPGEFVHSERLSDNVVRYEPGPREVFDHLVPHYVKGIIYGALVEAFSSEQHARMIAMDNATKSAEDMIGRLSLRYNRARQAEITQEISEIVAGIPAE